jgi:hypothetical protein
MIFQLLLISIGVFMLLQSFMREPRQRYATPAQEQIELARKMNQLRFRRINQDRERREQIELHQRLRVEMLASVFATQVSTTRLAYCMREQGL